MSAVLRLENHFNFNNMYMDSRPNAILAYFSENENGFVNLLNCFVHDFFIFVKFGIFHVAIHLYKEITFSVSMRE